MEDAGMERWRMWDGEMEDAGMEDVGMERWRNGGCGDGGMYQTVITSQV